MSGIGARIQKPARNFRSRATSATLSPAGHARQPRPASTLSDIPGASSVPLLEKLSPIFRVSLLGCTTDVSAPCTAAAGQREAARRLARAVDASGNGQGRLATLRHDLRTPL